jgi:hypothetical protein
VAEDVAADDLADILVTVPAPQRRIRQPRERVEWGVSSSRGCTEQYSTVISGYEVSNSLLCWISQAVYIVDGRPLGTVVIPAERRQSFVSPALLDVTPATDSHRHK